MATRTRKNPKAKVGRPPKAARDRKTHVVRVLLTETQRELLIRAASIGGFGLSTWLRSVALDAARVATGEPPSTKS